MFKEDWNASQFWVKSGRLLLAKKLTMEVQRRHGKDPSETATGWFYERDSRCRSFSSQRIYWTEEYPGWWEQDWTELGWWWWRTRLHLAMSRRHWSFWSMTIALEHWKNLSITTIRNPWTFQVGPFWRGNVYGQHSIAVQLKNRFDRILCDPPFLSEECQTKGKFSACQIVWARLISVLYSCFDCSMAFQAHRNSRNCLYWREDGIPHPQSLSRVENHDFRARTCPRSSW